MAVNIGPNAKREKSVTNRMFNSLLPIPAYECFFLIAASSKGILTNVNATIRRPSIFALVIADRKA